MKDIKEYIEKMKRFRQTDEQMKVIADRFMEQAHLVHATIGMVTEIGELADILKRNTIYGEKIDIEHAKEEIGDFLYYFGLALDVMGIDPYECMQGNFDKLSKRYPEGFSEEDAIKRADKDGLPDDKRKWYCPSCVHKYFDADEGADMCRATVGPPDDWRFGKNYSKRCRDIESCDDYQSKEGSVLVPVKKKEHKFRKWDGIGDNKQGTCKCGLSKIAVEYFSKDHDVMKTNGKGYRTIPADSSWLNCSEDSK